MEAHDARRRVGGGSGFYLCVVSAGLAMVLAASTGQAAAASDRATKRPALASIQVRPTSGPGGTLIRIVGSGFIGACPITISFTDSNGVDTTLETIPGASTFRTSTAIPVGAPQGRGVVSAFEQSPYWSCTAGWVTGKASFTVTP